MQNSDSDKNTKARKKHVHPCIFLLLFLMVFSLLTAVACDSEKKPGQSTSKSTKTGLPPGRLDSGEQNHVAFILDESITSENGENTYRGLQLISAANAECRYVENVPVSGAYELAERLIKAEYNVIFFNSAAFSEVALDIAKDNPDIMFFVVDGRVSNDNLVNISFRLEEQSFLLGAAASVLTPDDSIGLIARYAEDTEIDLSEIFEAGAKYVNPTADVHTFDLDPGQNDASAQTERLISMHEPSILAVMAGSASESAMSAARQAGLRIVSAEAGVKLLSPAIESTEINEETPLPDEAGILPEEGEIEPTAAPSAPTASTVIPWSPGATRSTVREDDPDLYDPASVKVLLKHAESYLYAYELFLSGDLPADTIYCGIKEELITAVDFASDISTEQIASIENIIDIIATGDVSIAR